MHSVVSGIYQAKICGMMAKANSGLGAQCIKWNLKGKICGMMAKANSSLCVQSSKWNLPS